MGTRQDRGYKQRASINTTGPIPSSHADSSHPPVTAVGVDLYSSVRPWLWLQQKGEDLWRMCRGGGGGEDSVSTGITVYFRGCRGCSKGGKILGECAVVVKTACQQV